jgi:hypothetical protein
MNSGQRGTWVWVGDSGLVAWTPGQAIVAPRSSAMQAAMTSYSDWDYNIIFCVTMYLALHEANKHTGRWSPTHDGLTYDFSALWWCKSDMHLAETILQISKLVLSLVSSVWYHPLVQCWAVAGVAPPVSHGIMRDPRMLHSALSYQATVFGRYGVGVGYCMHFQLIIISTCGGLYWDAIPE